MLPRPRRKNQGYAVLPCLNQPPDQAASPPSPPPQQLTVCKAPVRVVSTTASKREWRVGILWGSALQQVKDDDLVSVLLLWCVLLIHYRLQQVKDDVLVSTARRVVQRVEAALVIEREVRILTVERTDLPATAAG